MTGSTEFIVVGVDGSAAADEAAAWAAEEAVRRHCELRLIHAYVLPAHEGYGYPEWNPHPVDLGPVLRDHGQTMVNRLAAQLRGSHSDLTVSTKVLYARATVALRAESQHALLTVVGSGDTSRIYGVLLGSVALAIASTNPAPVAVIHAGRTPRVAGPVIVGVDGSRTSDAAVAFAFHAAAVRGADLVAVHVWDDVVIPGTHTLQNVLVDPVRIEQDARALLAERIAGWADKYPDVPVRQALVQGRAVTALLDQTKQAQLLVVGSHGRGGFAGMLLGSTSHSLIIHSNCPVVVVRPGSEN
jgi:nucleotide-binding universal stress UspA family protein